MDHASLSFVVTIVVSVLTVVITISGWSFWIGSKVATFTAKLEGFDSWRRESQTEHKAVWMRLDAQGTRLDDHGRMIAEHGVQIDGIVSNCKEFRDRHHGSER